jgi:DNA-directed RNA polymerase specialized sigma24 family protein
MGETGVWLQIESLYRAEFRRFERVARAIAGDRESGLEAVQDGFADALRHAGQWTGRGSLEGWVWRCVVNRARKARPQRLLASPTDDVQTNGKHEDSDLGVRVAGQPERQRMVLFIR